MPLQKGRPADLSDRLEKERRVYDFLDSLGVSFWRVDHEPAMSMEVCREINRELEAVICKNLFLCNRQETEFYLLMMPGDKPFKTKDLSAQIGSSRLSFASPEYMQEFLNATPGSASIMGLLFDTDRRVRLLIDEEVLARPFVGCHPCINTSSIRMATDDVKKTVIPALGHPPTIVSLPRYETEVVPK